MINRSAVIIRPKEPYIAWASGLDDSGIVPDAKGEPSIYLLPEYGNDAGAWELLEQAYEVIFDVELEAWHLDPKDWPKNRTFTMFREWFDVTFASLVEDFCEATIIDVD